MKRLDGLQLYVLILLVFTLSLFGYGAIASRADTPPSFTPLEFQGGGINAYRYSENHADHGCLVFIAVEGMGSPKPTVGCW